MNKIVFNNTNNAQKQLQIESEILKEVLYLCIIILWSVLEKNNNKKIQ